MSESCSGNCSSCSSCAGCEKKPTALDHIKRCILVLSGKGGVGKSTVSASLAAALAAKGRKVGLLDADFHGPSQPTLFGVNHLRLEGDENGSILPLELECGIKLVSVGLLIEDTDQAVVWRGPAKMAVLKQLIEETNWGELDDLILDFPPGTGDESLSACQLITGEKCAVVVTTPQEMSLADCRKCIDFCGKLDVPIAGIVENFAGFVCPDCGKQHQLFASGGGKELSERYSLPLLAQLPIDPVFMAKCDAGNLPSALKESVISKEIENISAVLL